MRSERTWTWAVTGLLLALPAAAGTPPAGFTPLETVVSGDCWGRWPDDVLAAVRSCPAADGNRLALRVIDDEDGPARVGIGEDCGAARCAPLAAVLQAAPQRRLLLRTPPARIDAALAALDAAQARSRAVVEPLLQRPQGASAPMTLAAGVRYWRQRADGPAPVLLHIAEIDLDTPGLHLVGTRGDRSGGGEFVATPTSAFVREHGLVLAINTDYFLPFDGGHLLDKPFVPAPGQGVTAEGLAIADGRLDSDARSGDLRVNAAFCVDARGRAAIVRGACARGTRLGVGAGPLLLLGGQRQPREASRADYYDKPEPRSAIGLDRARRRLWMVVADGRQPGYSEGMTLDALTAVFEQLGADAAMNLDGGGSSTLAARVDGRVRTLNSPIHTGIPGRERAVANQLGVRVDTTP